MLRSGYETARDNFLAAQDTYGVLLGDLLRMHDKTNAVDVAIYREYRTECVAKMRALGRLALRANGWTLDELGTEAGRRLLVSHDNRTGGPR
jgi:hypothetical protein